MLPIITASEFPSRSQHELLNVEKEERNNGFENNYIHHHDDNEEEEEEEDEEDDDDDNDNEKNLSQMTKRSVVLNEILHLEEDKPIVPGIMVRAASLEALVDMCIMSFDVTGNLQEDNNQFPYVLFLMHKWFTTSQELADKLIDHFTLCEVSKSCSEQSRGCPHTVHQMGTCDIYQHKAKVCHALRYWIRTFPVHFDMEEILASAIHSFQLQLIDEDCHNLADLVDLSKLPSYDWMRNISVRNPALKINRKVSLVFNHLEPEELAEHLTYLEHKAMRRIAFQDFKNYAQQGTLSDNTKLERSISLFNGLSQWIQCMVLSRTKPQQRAEVIVKFVNVAKRLQELKNFNTLMAVIGGLSHSALARLSKTLACVPPETQKMLQDFTELLSSTANFSNYRKALHESKGFKIPILGVHMKDLISLHVALPDTVEDDLINFRKMAQLSLIFQELNQLQNSDPPIDVNMDLVNTLRLSLDLAYTEDEIYELSLAREPRNTSSPQSSPTKPSVFAEWAAGVSSPLDPETIEKHIHAMVEAVYKNYDNDHDGYISQAEFESIAGNFPFIDSFCVLDADQDGMISKGEMKEYFLRANFHALRSGFKHDFHETTYFKPTFCAHCTGLLWGLIKQGFKCRDCGINAHKHCKDLVVMECRRLSTSSSRCNSVASSDGVVLKNRLKHWRRQQKCNSQTDCDVPPSPRLSGSGAPCKCESLSQSSDYGSGGSTCGDGSIHDRLACSEEARDRLAMENYELRSRLESAEDEIATLKQHMGEVRQETVAFILQQMETLKIQRDTAV